LILELEKYSEGEGAATSPMQTLEKKSFHRTGITVRERKKMYREVKSLNRQGGGKKSFSGSVKTIEQAATM